MTKHANYSLQSPLVEGILPGGVRPYRDAKRLELIDPEIKLLVAILNRSKARIETIASCEGHGVDYSTSHFNTFPYVLFKVENINTLNQLKSAIQGQMSKQSGANYNWQVRGFYGEWRIGVTDKTPQSDYDRKALNQDLRKLEQIVKKAIPMRKINYAPILDANIAKLKDGLKNRLNGYRHQQTTNQTEPRKAIKSGLKKNFT